MNRRSLAALPALAALSLAAVAAANATPISIAVSPSVVVRGHTVVVSGSAGSCTVGDTVFIMSRAFPATHTSAGVPALLAKVRAGGRFRASTRIPPTRAAARYVVTARCGGGNLGIEAHLTVRR